MLPVLIIFSRFPEPGKSKTRIIPALGPMGAARLHREMTRHTLRTARDLAQDYPVQVEVHFAGGDEGTMRQVFGGDFAYRLQVKGDLGEKMQAALAGALGRGADRAVVIGSDCPGLSARIVRQALEALRTRDLVLGPALDGGYYLIGCRQTVAPVFSDIPWGTDRVFARTMAAAQQAGLTHQILEALADVDRPEDLPIWEAARRQDIFE